MFEDILKRINELTWPAGKGELKEIQELLGAKKKITPLRKRPAYVAGVDSAFLGDRIISVACVFKYPELIPLEDRHRVRKVTFPYIPGLLSFREGPAVIEALGDLKIKPELIIFDGQGIAHPIGLGIASNTGVLLGVPSIGCAKSRLIGEYMEPGEKKGSWSPLCNKGQVIGAVLRTQDGVKPLFISPGHLIDLEGAIETVMACTGKYRLPEPVRRADMLSKKFKKAYM